jgi:hypothetical protein
MYYFRNGLLALQEVWGPETIAASLHANKAFTSVHNCWDFKPRKPRDSSTGLGPIKGEVVLEVPQTIPLPALLPATKTSKQVQWKAWEDMSGTEKEKKRAHDAAVKAAKQATAGTAQGTSPNQERGAGGKGKGTGRKGGTHQSGTPDLSTGRGQPKDKRQPDINLKVGGDSTESAWQVPDR